MLACTIFSREYAVDEPNINGSYHEGITGAEAEWRLKLIRTNSYLTCYGNKKKELHADAANTRGCYKELQDRYTERKYKIHGKQLKFDDIRSLLEHYERNRLDPAITNMNPTPHVPPE